MIEESDNTSQTLNLKIDGPKNASGSADCPEPSLPLGLKVGLKECEESLNTLKLFHGVDSDVELLAAKLAPLKHTQSALVRIQQLAKQEISHLSQLRLDASFSPEGDLQEIFVLVIAPVGSQAEAKSALTTASFIEQSVFNDIKTKPEIPVLVDIEC